MKIYQLTLLKTIVVTALIVLLQVVFIPLPKAFAATTPGLGFATTFGILSGTYTNTASGTTINGDLGYTTPPAVTPTVSGTTHVADSTYNQAGIDQNSALSTLNAQPCNFTFGSATDLNTLAQPLTPGVYCITGATSIGTGGLGGTGITLSSGTYIFRMTGALTTAANSIVTLSPGSSACDVFWTPGAATTLGANSTFAGTDIDASGVTIGSTVTWSGRSLAFGGTVSTTTDTISVPTCSTVSTTPPTPAASSSSSSNGSSSTTGTTAPCVADPFTTTVPVIIESKRLSATSVMINWGPYAGTNTFNVRYGLAEGTWLYNTDVTGFSTTINSLPANQPIWVEVAARNNCAIGAYGEQKLVGAPTLPGSGLAPVAASSNWYTPTNIVQGAISIFENLQKNTSFLFSHENRQ